MKYPLIPLFLCLYLYRQRTPCSCRILVSGVRKPTTYINLATCFLYEHGEVHMFALGSAIAAMVTMAEILKSRLLAVEDIS